jgi:myo-inositol-1(or 4)-monophosphatase
MPREDDLDRIRAALETARIILARFTPGAIDHRAKEGGSPVTDADLAVNDALRDQLPRDGEGWLSEETADDPSRLSCSRTWIVDPLDGTKEFVAGVPEWCVSIGLVEEGRAVAGGIMIPPTGDLLLGSVETGATLNGEPCRTSGARELRGAEVLASRSESARGEWDQFRDAEFHVRPTGSVAYKIAQIAAGRADATWTRVPKNEWDVAGGVALVTAAGGRCYTPDGAEPRFNRPRTRLAGLLAAPAGLAEEVRAFLGWG